MLPPLKKAAIAIKSIGEDMFPFSAALRASHRVWSPGAFNQLSAACSEAFDFSICSMLSSSLEHLQPHLIVSCIGKPWVRK